MACPGLPACPGVQLDTANNTLNILKPNCVGQCDGSSDGNDQGKNTGLCLFLTDEASASQHTHVVQSMDCLCLGCPISPGKDVFMPVNFTRGWAGVPIRVGSLLLCPPQRLWSSIWLSAHSSDVMVS